MNEDTQAGPVVWLKDKYARPKDKGRYKGGTNASVKTGAKRRKVGGGPSPIEHVMVLGLCGRPTTWVTRPREGGRR